MGAQTKGGIARRPRLVRVSDGWQIEGWVPPAVFLSLEAFEVWWEKQARPKRDDDEPRQLEMELTA